MSQHKNHTAENQLHLNIKVMSSTYDESNV